MKKLLLILISTLLLASNLFATWGGGDGSTAENAITINTVEDLALWSKSGSGFPGKYFKLTADLDLTAYLAPGGAGYADWGDAGWQPIGVFEGNFDGNSHSIIGLKSTRNGLFGRTTNLTSISNLGVAVDLDTGVGSEKGGLVGWKYGGTISNCYTTGYLKSTAGDCIGGLVGFNEGGNISNSYSSVRVNGHNNSIGGLVGANLGGTISNCYANRGIMVEGNKIARNDWCEDIGGLVGYNSGTISSSYATGWVVSHFNYYLNNTTPLFPSDWFDGDNVGGLVGCNDGAISNCYSTGTTNTLNSYFIGGLVGGGTGGIVNCYSTSSVSIGGHHPDDGMSPSGGYGSIAGDSRVSVNNSFYDKDIHYNNAIILGTRKTSEEMKQQATYTNWDFTTPIWKITENVTFPSFAWQDMSKIYGTYTVGVGGTGGTGRNFTSLTKADGLFAAINRGYITGDITVNIISDLTESGDVVLNAWTELGAGSHTLTIQPLPGDNLLRTISGDANSNSALLNLNWVKRVTIDGTPGKYLAFVGNSAVQGSYNVINLSGTDCKITNCLISNTNLQNTAVTALKLVGSNNEISKNKICSINGSDAADITGISLLGAGNNLNNNMVTLSFATTGSLTGIAADDGSAKLSFNSVFIGGTQSGSNSSYAFNRNGTLTGLFGLNNIFYNARTNSTKAGSGKHYAVYLNNSTGLGILDYNLLYSASGVIVSCNSTDYPTLTEWKDSGIDLNSQSSAILFEDNSAGDLRFKRDATNAAVFDKGTPVSGIEDDYFSKSRTSQFYAKVDIGAYELPQSSAISENNLPLATTLTQNYPNPFNPVTAIKYELRVADNVKLTIFNSKGELMKTLFNGMQNAGRYSVNFDGAGYNSGVYFYKLEADGKNMVKRMIMIK